MPTRRGRTYPRCLGFGGLKNLPASATIAVQSYPVRRMFIRGRRGAVYDTAKPGLHAHLSQSQANRYPFPAMALTISRTFLPRETRLAGRMPVNGRRSFACHSRTYGRLAGSHASTLEQHHNPICRSNARALFTRCSTTRGHAHSLSPARTGVLAKGALPLACRSAGACASFHRDFALATCGVHAAAEPSVRARSIHAAKRLTDGVVVDLHSNLFSCPEKLPSLTGNPNQTFTRANSLAGP